jgi:hypothetical protein
VQKLPENFRAEGTDLRLQTAGKDEEKIQIAWGSGLNLVMKAYVT